MAIVSCDSEREIETATFEAEAATGSSSALHRAVNDNELTEVRHIIGDMMEVVRLGYLLQADENFDTALHLAVREQNLALVLTLLDYVKPDQRKELLIAKNNSESTALHLAVQMNKRKHLIQILLKDIPANDCLEILEQVNNDGETVMHVAASYCRPDLLRCLLDFIPSVQFRSQLLVIKDHRLRTALHGCGRDNACLRYMLGEVDIKTRLQIVTSWKGNVTMLLDVLEMSQSEAKILVDWQDEKRNNFLHLASKEDHVKSAKMFLSLLEECDINKVLAQLNSKGKTPYNTAKKSKMRAVLTWADKEKGFYLLSTPPVVLVMYQTEDRSQAEDEWASLRESLPEFQIEPIVKPNLTADGMLGAINEAINANDDISSLIIFIMAHGAKGLVWGKGDTPLLIQEVLTTMNHPSLDGKPKVLLVQACQGRNNHHNVVNLADQKRFAARKYDGPTPGNARRATPVQSNQGRVSPSVRQDFHSIVDHFCQSSSSANPVPELSDEILSSLVSDQNREGTREATVKAAENVIKALSEFTRAQRGDGSSQQTITAAESEIYNLKHRDTVTIIATIGGGIAARNEMIPIFARLLKNSTEAQCISEIYLKMHDELRGKVHDQIPEFRTTLSKKLCLRKIFQPGKPRYNLRLLACVRPSVHAT